MDAPKSSAPARPTEDPKTRLAKLEERYRHEIFGEDERLELWESILAPPPQARPLGRGHALNRARATGPSGRTNDSTTDEKERACTWSCTPCG